MIDFLYKLDYDDRAAPTIPKVDFNFKPLAEVSSKLLSVLRTRQK
jgi:hypothetical protein